MENLYADNRQELEDQMKDVLATYEAYAKKIPNHTQHTDGYIQGLRDILSEDVKKYAASSEKEIDDVYDKKRKSMERNYMLSTYAEGYVQAYNDLWKMCFGQAPDILGTVEAIKQRHNLP